MADMVECKYRRSPDAANGIHLTPDDLYSKRDNNGGFFHIAAMSIGSSEKTIYMCNSPKLFEAIAGEPALPICPEACWELNEKTCKWSSDFIPLGAIE